MKFEMKFSDYVKRIIDSNGPTLQHVMKETGFNERSAAMYIAAWAILDLIDCEEFVISVESDCVPYSFAHPYAQMPLTSPLFNYPDVSQSDFSEEEFWSKDFARFFREKCEEKGGFTKKTEEK